MTRVIHAERHTLCSTCVGSAELTSAIAGDLRALPRHPDGGVSELTASQAIVLATGAVPRVLHGVRARRACMITAREAVFLEQLPEHLIVLGGGVIGMELGGAYQRLGSRVSVVGLTSSSRRLARRSGERERSQLHKHQKREIANDPLVGIVGESPARAPPDAEGA